MNLRLVTTAAVTVAFLVGLGWLGYLFWSWDIVQTVPGLTGWAAKLVISGKVLKGAVVAALAVVAGTAALAQRVRGRLRRETAAREKEAAPQMGAAQAPSVDQPDR
jgi:hypothetical protein